MIKGVLDNINSKKGISCSKKKFGFTFSFLIDYKTSPLTRMGFIVFFPV